MLIEEVKERVSIKKYEEPLNEEEAPAIEEPLESSPREEEDVSEQISNINAFAK